MLIIDCNSDNPVYSVVQLLLNKSRTTGDSQYVCNKPAPTTIIYRNVDKNMMPARL
jgi:hypothetical protein